MIAKSIVTQIIKKKKHFCRISRSYGVSHAEKFLDKIIIINTYINRSIITYDNEFYDYGCIFSKTQRFHSQSNPSSNLFRFTYAINVYI